MYRMYMYSKNLKEHFCSDQDCYIEPAPNYLPVIYSKCTILFYLREGNILP